MSWRPEHGWPWLAGRWTVAAGAGALLGGAVWLGEPGPAATALDPDPTSTREVVLEPGEQAELSSLVPAPDEAVGAGPGGTAGAPTAGRDPDRADAGPGEDEPASTGPDADVDQETDPGDPEGAPVGEDQNDQDRNEDEDEDED